MSGLEFEIVARGLFSPACMRVEYDPDLRMPATPAITEQIEQEWQDQLAQARKRGALLYDAPLFRFVEARTRADGTLHLVIGDTGYKEYVATRAPAFAQHHARHELGNALAACSVIETSDGSILLDKRTGVDVYEGRYHVIGGFCERERDMYNGQPDFFAAIQREIREETGILAGDISEQYCLGIVYDLLTPHGELCFLTRLSISLQTVLQQRMAEDQEVKKLYPLYTTSESLRAFILSHHGNISATGEPNLLLYGAWKFGEQWYEEVYGAIARKSGL